MSDLATRPGRKPPRRQRQQRAYQLALVGGGAAIVTLVATVLAIFGIGSFGLAFVTAIIAVVCWLLFKRTVAK